MALSIPVRKSPRTTCSCSSTHALKSAKPRSVDPTKLILAIQYWDGDKAQAERFLRLIADMQDGMSNEAVVLISARFDSSIDPGLVEYVSRKFPVHTLIGKRRGTGWPFGCNEVWFETMLWVFSHRRAGTFRDCKAVVTMEADDVPLAKDWISRLSAAYDSAGVPVVGHLHSWDRRTPETLAASFHCNGNAIFGLVPGLERVLTSKQGVPANSPWDCYMAPAFRKLGWFNTPAIRSLYNTKGLREKTFLFLRDRGGAFVHGLKDDSGLNIARRLFVGA